LPGALDRAASAESLGAARAFLRGLDVELEPRKMWTAGIAAAAGRDDWKGRISAGLAGLPGRALAFADDPAWEEMAGVTGPGVPDAEAPAWALEGLATLLDRWLPTMGQPPAAVVPVPSAGRPRLVASLADAVGAHLGVRVVHALEAAGPAPDPTLSAAARARALAPRFRLRAGFTVPDVPVLLVDDTWRSGWTATFATAVLRDVGARSVTPLVLHQLP
jgi:ATP-dependent DNA helicase RecQ